jgi:Integrase core domain
LGAPISEGQGKARRTWVLRMVLSYSRKAYSEAVTRQDTETFLRCLENGLRSLGGSPLILNLDNMKTAVLKADWFDPEINPKLSRLHSSFDGSVPKAIYPLLNANPAVNSDVVGSNGESTSQITSRPASRVSRGFTPETTNHDAQANSTSWSPANRPDSARVIHTKVANVRLRSFVRPRYVDAKTRLIALWHQSLQREKFRSWTLFSNSNSEQRKKVSYTAATSH